MKQLKIAVSMNLDWPLKRYHELFRGIQDYVTEYTNWMLIWDHFPEQRLKECKSAPYYDGVIGRVKYDAYDEIKRLNIPAVNTWAASYLKDIPSVLVDFAAVGEIAAGHLIKKGFRNFVHFHFKSGKFRQSFKEGFLKVLKPYQCNVDEYLISHKMDYVASMWKKFNDDFDKWSKNWKYPLAIASTMSSIGPKIVNRCLENNIRVPQDVAIVSVGNELPYCEGRYPTISSVDINYHKVGYEAARILDLQLQGKELERNLYLIKPRGFVARESTDNYSVEDKHIKAALRFVSENYQKNIQVIDVVEAVDIARSTLERKFTSIIGHSIFDEINRLRVASVKRLLIETEQDIKNICLDSGFSSPHHLRRAFLKSVGMNPGEFRKQNK